MYNVVYHLLTILHLIYIRHCEKSCCVLVCNSVNNIYHKFEFLTNLPKTSITLIQFMNFIEKFQKIRFEDLKKNFDLIYFHFISASFTF